MKSKKAFLLFEVTLTIAILSLGLVFVVRSISMSMKVARAAFNYSQAVNLAYEKMFDLELASQTDGLGLSSDEGIFADSDNFSWKYFMEPLDNENLGIVVLDISWKEGGRTGGFDVVTYIKTEE
jgi:hypothetical protein